MTSPTSVTIPVNMAGGYRRECLRASIHEERIAPERLLRIECPSMRQCRQGNLCGGIQSLRPDRYRRLKERDFIDEPGVIKRAGDFSPALDHKAIDAAVGKMAHRIFEVDRAVGASGADNHTNA